jgi:hypothetical protein
VEELPLYKCHQDFDPNKIDPESFVNGKVPYLSWKISHSINDIRLLPNKIGREPFVNGQVPSLIVEELPINKCYPDKMV